MATKNYRDLPCPRCKTKGTIYLDNLTSVFRCRECGLTDFDPFEGRLPEKSKAKPKATTGNGYPPIPAGTLQMDVVQEYVPEIVDNPQATQWIEGVGKTKTKPLTKIHQIHCPRQAVPELEFNPNSLMAQYAIKSRKKAIQNTKRLNRDRTRRGKQKQEGG